VDAGIAPGPAPDPFDAEQPGTKVRIRGSVSHFHPGGACVDFPTATGGVLGVATNLQNVKVGSIVTLDAEVIAAKRDSLKVKFVAGGQEAELARHRVTFEEGNP